MSAEEVVDRWGRKRHATKSREGKAHGVKHAKLKLMTIIGLGLVSLTTLVILSLTYGTIKITFLDALDSTISLITKFGDPEGMNEMVIYHLRMPRAVAVIVVGAGLSAAGAIMQALIRNPLVDPYITGVSSGAGFAVTLAVLGGVYRACRATVPYPLLSSQAFFLTHDPAEGAGAVMSYVLSGVIIGIGLWQGAADDVQCRAGHGILF